MEITKITKITKEEAYKIIETKEPLGLFWLIDEGAFIAIDNSHGEAFVEEFQDKEEGLQWLKDWFKKPGCEELYGDRKVRYNRIANSIRDYNDDLHETIDVKKVSDLITNMTLAGANYREMVQAINYSIDVLDAFKCELRSKQNRIDRCKESRVNNGIQKLEEKYMKEV